MRFMAPLVAGLAALVVLTVRGSTRKDGCVHCPVEFEEAMRDAAVAAAVAEFERVNAPGAPKVDPQVYWEQASATKLSPAELKIKDWCGGFYLWVLRVVGIAKKPYWKFDGTGLQSAKLRQTSKPQKADLAYFRRKQHHAFIERVDGDTIYLINGNGGGKGITRTAVPRKSVAAFYSIAPLLEAAAAEGTGVA